MFTQRQIYNLNILYNLRIYIYIYSIKMEFLLKNRSRRKNKQTNMLGPDAFTGKLYQTCLK